MLNVGVYTIKNKASGKIYIGSSNNLEKRKQQHFKELREKRHINKNLQSDFEKYGEENFIFFVIEYSWRSNRLEIEQKWINKYKKSGILYNIGTANSDKSRRINMFSGIMNSVKKIFASVTKVLVDRLW